jgi:hypothetical protein
MVGGFGRSEAVSKDILSGIHGLLGPHGSASTLRSAGQRSKPWAATGIWQLLGSHLRGALGHLLFEWYQLRSVDWPGRPT